MESVRQKLIEKMLKIKALAEEGKAGEKEAAKKKLILLMDRYGLTDDDLNEKELYFWKYKRTDTLSKSLLHQVIYSVMGNVNLKCHERTPDIGCYCTKSEAVEIEAKYNFYYEALKKDLDIFYRAFIMTNNIYPSDDKVPPKEDHKPISEETRKAFQLSQNMEAKHFYKQLN